MAAGKKKSREKSSAPVIEGEILSEESPEETVVLESSGKAAQMLRRIGWYMAAAAAVFIAGLVAAPGIQERIDSLLGREPPAEAAPPAARPAAQEDSLPAAVSEVAGTPEIEPEREAAEAPASGEQASETAPPEAESQTEVLPAELLTDIPAEAPAETQVPASADYEKTIERLNARLDALEARLVKAEALGGAGVAGAGADRMLLALARLSQRLDAGQAYGGEMLEFSAFFAALPAQARAANDSQMRVLADAADSGVRNAALLGRDFAAALPAVLAAAALPEDAGWWDKLWAGLKSVVVVRRVGQVEGAGAEAALARAEFNLENGNIAAALTEVQSLEPRVQDALAPWQAEAAKSIAARRALDALIETYSVSAIQPPGPPSPASPAEGG